MDTNVEALKGLYVVLGGNIEDVEDITLISDMITEIAKVASTSGDSGAKIIPTTYSASSTNCMIDDYDYSKLRADVEAGKVIGVYANWYGESSMRLYTPAEIRASSITFECVVVTAKGVTSQQLTYSELGNGEASSARFKLPDVTADDNGDVLTVVNGSWNKATPQ